MAAVAGPIHFHVTARNTMEILSEGRPEMTNQHFVVCHSTWNLFYTIVHSTRGPGSWLRAAEARGLERAHPSPPPCLRARVFGTRFRRFLRPDVSDTTSRRRLHSPMLSARPPVQPSAATTLEPEYVAWDYTQWVRSVSQVRMF